MPDASSFDLQVHPKVAPAATSKNAQSSAVRVGGHLSWIAICLIASAAIFPMISQFNMRTNTMSLLAASGEGVRERLASDGLTVEDPAFLETLSELGLEIQDPDVASAEAAARKAVALDPSRAFVWARLAWLETQKTGGRVNEASLAALSRSMDACPLCDEELIRWRFNFVLANWQAVPDPLRRRAFEHADLLRWIGPNAEFLAEMRIKAKQKGIPFDAYRSAVDTPVRTWDIMTERSPSGA